MKGVFYKFIKGTSSILQMITEKQQLVFLEFLRNRKNKVAQYLSFFKDLVIRDRLAYFFEKHYHLALKGNYHTLLVALLIFLFLQILSGFQFDGNVAFCAGADQPNGDIDLKIGKQPDAISIAEPSNDNDSFATKYPGAATVITAVVTAVISAVSTGGSPVKGVAAATVGTLTAGAMVATNRELKIAKDAAVTVGTIAKDGAVTVGTSVVEPIDTIPTSPTSTGNTHTFYSIRENPDQMADRFPSPTGNEQYNIDGAIKFLIDHPFFLNNLDRIIYKLTIVLTFLLLLTGILFWGILLSRYSLTIVNLFKRVMPEKYHYLFDRIHKRGQQVNSFYLIVIAMFLFCGLVFTLYVLYTVLSLIVLMKGN
uniref:Uncharacterized protein orf366 n=1 Tax=Chlorokybus atmophyticus TaxID=3144 RepID=A6YE77_CHLAT|nr:hypothetical protein Chatpmp05 [Chlorokybus atmophyticus]ABO15130.1 hypothetical protein [Chlorokybus atmophyticus]